MGDHKDDGINIDPAYVRALAELLDDTSLTEIEVEDGDRKVRVARERPRCGVIGLTPFLETARKLALVWGVRSVVTEDVHNVEEMVEKVR